MIAHKTGRRIVTRARFGLAGVLVVVLSVGCAGPRRLPFQAHRYRIDVQLEPGEHRLVGRTVIDLARPDEFIVPPEAGPVALEVKLHPNLEVSDAKVSGATLLRYTKRPALEEEESPITPVIHQFVLEEPVDALTLFLEYGGELFQDVAAGEKPGEIHNFAVQAHVGTEGIYLGGAHWYPSPIHDEEMTPRLAEFELTCNRIDGFELVASAESDPALAADAGRLGWRSPYPLDSVVLVGGPHEIHRTHHNGVEIRAHFKPDQADYAEGFLSAVKGYFDRYEPLVGPYPAKEYTVVDNFFSSGFAFPMFTLLFSDVIQMGRRAQMRHGMLDHEFLHSWWGNGVFVDPRDGNWCESLTSYYTNYYGYVLDGKEDEARRKRRNYCHFLSSLKPEDDKPLGTYDQPDGCGRGIAYNKGAMVFHMLARKIGEETLFAAMRRLTGEYTGRHASWEDIRRLCEEEAGQSLERFFYQWVREGGAPMLEVLSASFDSAEQALTLTISQGESGFDLEVPVRIVHEDGVLDLTVPMSESVIEATFKVEVVPRTVIVDPDYHVFRKVGLGEIVPTTARTRYGSAFAAVIPEGDLPEQYAGVKEIFEGSFEEDERITFVAGEVRRGELAERCLLILGDVVCDPYVDAYLRSINYPVAWPENGFVFDGVEYMEPAHAILCTARHPGIEGGGITVIFANSEEAIPPARNIPFYDRSVVIFKDRMPILRKDLESPKEVPVEVN